MPAKNISVRDDLSGLLRGNTAAELSGEVGCQFRIGETPPNVVVTFFASTATTLHLDAVVAMPVVHRV